MGVPYDEGTTYRSGTRFGPRAIRNASMFYAYEGAKDRFYDADRNIRFQLMATTENYSPPSLTSATLGEFYPAEMF